MSDVTILHPQVGPVRLGRTPPHPGRRRLRFGTFVRDEAAFVPPATTAYSPVAQPCLDQMMLNDRLSCCTSATSFHVAGLLLGNAGVPVKFSNEQVEDFYSLSTGYVRGRPDTDQGGDELTVLDCWKRHGLEKHLHGIAGHLAVDGADAAHVRTCLWLFGNLYFGVSLPDSWLSVHDGATLGDSQPANPRNGHAFCGVCYDEVGVWCVLWGGIKVRLTWPAVAKYTAPAALGELHAVVSPDAVAKNTRKAYSGIDWAGMMTAFRTLGGTTS